MYFKFYLHYRSHFGSCFPDSCGISSQRVDMILFYSILPCLPPLPRPAMLSRLYMNTQYGRLAFTRPGRIPLFSNVIEFKNVVKFNIAGVVKINNVVKFNLGVTSFWRRTWGPINCFDDKSKLTLVKIYQK